MLDIFHCCFSESEVKREPKPCYRDTNFKRTLISSPRFSEAIRVLNSDWLSDSIMNGDWLYLGSYALHTDPIVRCNLVSVSVCQCVTLRTRRHVTRRLLAGRLGTSNSKLFRRPLLLPSCCCGCVLNCSRFLCVWKILKSFPSQISSICSR